jgi:hypothetical protein
MVGVFFLCLLSFKGIHIAGILIKNGTNTTTCRKEDSLEQRAVGLEFKTYEDRVSENFEEEFHSGQSRDEV